MRKILCFCFHLLSVLSVQLMAQPVTSENQRGSYNQLAVDTNRVISLLKKASQYSQLIPAGGMQDSAQHFLTAAAKLSKESGYTNGLEQSYLEHIKLLMKVHDINLAKGRPDSSVFSRLLQVQQQLIRLVEKQGNSAKTGALLLELEDLYADDEHNFQTKIELATRARQQFRNAKDKSGEATSLFEIGDSYIGLGNLEEALNFLNESYKLKEYIPPHSLMVLNSNIGIVNTFLGDFNKGLEYGLEAERIAVASNDTSDYLPMLYNNIGITYEGARVWKKSIEYYQKALAEAEKKNDLVMIIPVATNIAKIMSLSDPKQSLNFMEGILRKHPLEAEDDAYIRIQIRHMIDYHRINEIDKAQQYCDQLLNASNKMKPTDPMQTVILSPVIKFLVNTNQYDEAAKQLPRYEQMVEKMGIVSFIKEAAFRWYQIDSARGNLHAAIRSLRRYHAINDSLFNVSKSKEFAELNIKYETEKKDNSIRLKDNELRLNFQNILLLKREASIRKKDIEQTRLRFQFDSLARVQALNLLSAETEKKDNELKVKQQDITLLKGESLLQDARLSQTRMTRNIIIVSAVALLLLLALTYNRYKMKQRASQLINEKNVALQQMVNEKEWLLKEVHHRVKNNLQTVVSLLESQSAYLQSDALLAIQDSQNRVHAMSLVHQKLYQAENVASINLIEYLPELVRYLKDSFSAKQVHFGLEIAPVELDVSQAIPVGLIVNEAITNAIKYAFPGNEKGNEIRVIVKEIASGNIRLTIADNGIGLPSAFSLTRSSGLGLKLMQGLTEDLNGKFDMQSVNGTSISISFTANTPLHKAPVYTQAANPVTYA